ELASGQERSTRCPHDRVVRRYHADASSAAPPHWPKSNIGTSAPLVYRPPTMHAWPEQIGLLFYPRMLYVAQRRCGLMPILGPRNDECPQDPDRGRRLRTARSGGRAARTA